MKPGSNALKIYSWNVQGANHPIKKKKILNFLKKERADIALLQETHLSKVEHDKFKKEWVGQVYSASFSSRSRGVAILIRKQLPFVIETVQPDPNGCYVLIQGHLYGENIVILNVYAPPNSPPNFFTMLTELTSPYISKNIIIGGDWNCILNSNLDRSPQANCLSKSSKTIIKIMNEMGWVDIWRLKNPLVKDFTFYSNPHKSYSRLDYFLIPRSLSASVLDCTIGSIHISDHAPINLNLTLQSPIHTFRWQCNRGILSDPEFCDYIRKELAMFLEMNDNGTVNPSILWETSKAYLRGLIISFCSGKKKKMISEQKNLEAELVNCEQTHKQYPTKENYEKIMVVRAALNTLLSQQAEKSLFFNKHRLYEHGNKPGNVLSKILSNHDSHNSVACLKDSHGKRCLTSEEINAIFTKYYKLLYTSEICKSDPPINAFLEQLNLPQINEQQQQALNKPITCAEINEAIDDIPSGKAAGPDGFPPEFYKAFKDIITPLLSKMFEHSFITQRLPESTQTAAISLILKQGKNSEKPSSYRPISLQCGK